MRKKHRRRKNKRTKSHSHMVVWFLYVVLLSLLPLGIKAFLYFLDDKNIFFADNKALGGELFFFTLLISTDILKTLAFDKTFEQNEVMHHIIHWTSVALIVISSLLYGLLVADDIISKIKLSFNYTKLKYAAISMSGLGFVTGTAVQIIHSKNEANKPSKRNQRKKAV